MSQSPSQISSYPSHVQKILRRLQQSHGDDATGLALQALEAFARTRSSGGVAQSQPHVLSQAERTLLTTAYTKCRQQTGSEWIHHAMLYAAVKTIEPPFEYDPIYKTWPKFLCAQQTLFESRVMHEQLHVRLISAQLQ